MSQSDGMCFDNSKQRRTTFSSNTAPPDLLNTSVGTDGSAETLSDVVGGTISPANDTDSTVGYFKPAVLGDDSSGGRRAVPKMSFAEMLSLASSASPR